MPALAGLAGLRSLRDPGHRAGEESDSRDE